MYEVKIRGATRSIYSPSKLYDGTYSESRKIFVALDCDRLSLSHVQSVNEIFGHEFSGGVIAAMVCTAFAAILLLLSIVLWRKYFQVRAHFS